MPRDSGVFGSRRERLEARCAAADANADAASTGDKLSRITAIRARGSGGDSKTFRSLTPRAPGAKCSPSRKSTCGATPTTSARGWPMCLLERSRVSPPRESVTSAKKDTSQVPRVTAVSSSCCVGAEVTTNCGEPWILPILFNAGAPLPRVEHAAWMRFTDKSMEGVTEMIAARRWVERIAAAGGWAAYKKARPASLARIFEPKFPQLPTEIIPIIVEFSFRKY